MELMTSKLSFGRMEDTQTSGGIELMYLGRVKYEINIIITTNLGGTATSSFTWFSSYFISIFFLLNKIN